MDIQDGQDNAKYGIERILLFFYILYILSTHVYCELA